MDLIELANRSSEISNRHPWELARAEVMLKFIKQKLNTKEILSVLDLGCGDTFLVEFLAKKLPSVKFYAVDIAFTDELIVKLQKNINPQIKIYKSQDEMLNDELNLKVDLVLLLDVIEHIDDDIAFMKDLKSRTFTTEDTSILISVPSYQSLFCSHDVFLGHYRRYTNSTLKRNLNQSGYSVTVLQYFFTTLILPRVLKVILEKLKGAKSETTGLVEWNGSRRVTILFKTILVIDYSISSFLNRIGINLPGLSNMALCKISD